MRSKNEACIFWQVGKHKNKMKNPARSSVNAFLILCVALMSTISIHAQQTTRRPIVGIKGGINFANLYVSDVKDENLKIGANAGFYAKLPIARGISIQPELLYSNKGAKDTYNNVLQGSGQYRFNLNYLETPLLMVFNLTPNFNIQAGGYLAYLASANVKDVNRDGTIYGVRDLNADSFHRVDYGLAAGFGFDIQNMTFGARYSYGLQNIGRSGNLSGDLTRDSKNSVATLFIGFAF
jgi:hypothetical protein